MQHLSVSPGHVFKGGENASQVLVLCLHAFPDPTGSLEREEQGCSLLLLIRNGRKSTGGICRRPATSACASQSIERLVSWITRSSLSRLPASVHVSQIVRTCVHVIRWPSSRIMVAGEAGSFLLLTCCQVFFLSSSSGSSSRSRRDCMSQATISGDWIWVKTSERAFESKS